MEAAAGTRSRLLLVLALVAGLLGGGALAARSAPARALPAPPVPTALPAAQPAGATVAPGVLSRTAGSGVLVALLGSAAGPTGSAGTVPPAVRLPTAPEDPADAGRALQTSPATADASTQQDRGPPRPAST